MTASTARLPATNEIRQVSPASSPFERAAALSAPPQSSPPPLFQLRRVIPPIVRPRRSHTSRLIAAAPSNNVNSQQSNLATAVADLFYPNGDNTDGGYQDDQYSPPFESGYMNSQSSLQNLTFDPSTLMLDWLGPDPFPSDSPLLSALHSPVPFYPERRAVSAVNPGYLFSDASATSTASAFTTFPDHSIDRPTATFETLAEPEVGFNRWERSLLEDDHYLGDEQPDEARPLEEPPVPAEPTASTAPSPHEAATDTDEPTFEFCSGPPLCIDCNEFTRFMESIKPQEAIDMLTLYEAPSPTANSAVHQLAVLYQQFPVRTSLGVYYHDFNRTLGVGPLYGDITIQLLLRRHVRVRVHHPRRELAQLLLQ